MTVLGEAPDTQQLRDIGAWLDTKPRGAVFTTAQLAADEPSFAPLTPFASGLAATALSHHPGEYLIWFQRERIHTVTWGGDPFKAVVIGDDPRDLSPRRSFARWHQLVEGTCDPWTKADIATARLIGDTVADVAMQFGAVRLLIAQDQVAQVLGQVKSSDQPVVIADAAGRVLLINDAFHALVEATNIPIRHLDDLPRYFAQPAEIERRLKSLRGQAQVWRGEALLQTPRDAAVPLLVRGDPVLAEGKRALGYVLMFTDLTKAKAAETARRGFQEGILGNRRVPGGGMDSQADLMFRTLMSGLVENAQLAALEITDAADTSDMPNQLDSIRASVARTAEVLEHLIRHSGGADGDKP